MTKVFPFICNGENGHAPRRLTVRLAENAEDLSAVQHLRWRVFHEEMGAQGKSILPSQLDCDDYDQLCDHLLVMDESAEGADKAVGTYRLLRESVARKNGGFYSASEFNIGLLERGPARPQGELLELGRSCVLPQFRTSATIQLLWRGIADYIARYNIGLMFGCASFAGTDPNSHAEALSLLYHRHLAPENLRTTVREGHGQPLERLAFGTYDERRALLALPPLVKGYLRAGACFGDGVYIDHDFNTVDVSVILPVEQISRRYSARFTVAAA